MDKNWWIISTTCCKMISILLYTIFVDMLSHARTEMEVLKELAGDEASYRSITASWFEHSPLYAALKKIADKKITMIVATDHGSVRGERHRKLKVIGDKQTTVNLRYKHGRNLNYEAKEVLAFRDPREAGLPVPNVNSSFIFAKGDLFLCYPNNYNHFVNYYKRKYLSAWRGKFRGDDCTGDKDRLLQTILSLNEDIIPEKPYKDSSIRGMHRQ